MDRGIIKWRPFNSLGNTSKMILASNKQKTRISMPILSEDQVYEINDKIKCSLNNLVNIKYYQNGYLYEINGTIKKIDAINKYLYINNKRIYFRFIVKFKIF